MSTIRQSSHNLVSILFRGLSAMPMVPSSIIYHLY